MKRIFFVSIFAATVFALASFVAGAQSRSLTLDDIHIRDPYILPVEKEGVYYMYASSPVKRDGISYGGVVAYKSRDLKTWEGPERVFEVPSDNSLTGTVWAPEVHKYKGKYYLFATMNSDIRWKGYREGHPPFNHRATQIFWSKNPDGPFVPFESRQPHTPQGQMCLDGTLWVENGVPYMVYCHEWVETMDGEMCLVQLKKDLSEPVGQPVRLFCASAADWSTGSKVKGSSERTYVTDGCFLYRTRTDKLLMIWSSFKNGSYAIGIAESVTGQVAGPWRQQKETLFDSHGGHGMLFRDFDGRLCLVFHSPNSPSPKERAHIYEIEDLGHTLKLKAELL
jgi:GH43 family beta-xylosidase